MMSAILSRVIKRTNLVCIYYLLSARTAPRTAPQLCGGKDVEAIVKTICCFSLKPTTKRPASDSDMLRANSAKMDALALHICGVCTSGWCYIVCMKMFNVFTFCVYKKILCSMFYLAI